MSNFLALPTGNPSAKAFDTRCCNPFEKKGDPDFTGKISKGEICSEVALGILLNVAYTTGHWKKDSTGDTYKIQVYYCCDYQSRGVNIEEIVNQAAKQSLGTSAGDWQSICDALARAGI